MKGDFDINESVAMSTAFGKIFQIILCAKNTRCVMVNIMVSSKILNENATMCHFAHVESEIRCGTTIWGFFIGPLALFLF